MINQFKYGQTWNIWPSPLSLSLYITFKLGSLQLICEVSLTFKSNLELVLSIILKEREFYESKHVVVESRCLKYETRYRFWDVSQS